jgi:hypothetical protein
MPIAGRESPSWQASMLGVRLRPAPLASARPTQAGVRKAPDLAAAAVYTQLARVRRTRPREARRHWAAFVVRYSSADQAGMQRRYVG